MEKISWTEHVRNEKVLLRVKEQGNILHETRKRKANWIDHILHRNCLLQRVIEGKTKWGREVTRRRWWRRRKLLDDLKERREYSHLKEESLDCTMWRARFGRSFGPVVRQTTEWMNVRLSLFVCSSVCIDQFGSKWKDFHETSYLNVFLISRRNSSFIKIWQELRVLYMKIIVQDVQLKSGPYFNMSNLFTRIYKVLYYTTNLYLQ
jgi:hypothetical protein